MHIRACRYIYKQCLHCRMSCLVFNHPRSEGWSLHGQVYSTSFCLSSSSICLQTAFRYILPCCPSFASLVSLIFLLPVYSSALHDFFLQTISLFSHHVSKV